MQIDADSGEGVGGLMASARRRWTWLETTARKLEGAKLLVAALWASSFLGLLARLGKRAAVFTVESAIVFLLGAAYVTFAEHAWNRARSLRIIGRARF